MYLEILYAGSLAWLGPLVEYLERFDHPMQGSSTHSGLARFELLSPGVDA